LEVINYFVFDKRHWESGMSMDYGLRCFMCSCKAMALLQSRASMMAIRYENDFDLQFLLLNFLGSKMGTVVSCLFFGLSSNLI